LISSLTTAISPLPINALDIFIINPRLVLADRGEQKEGPQPEEPKNDKARPFFERRAEASLGKI
jgi:hypothetical protein